MDSALGVLLKRHRAASGLTQEALAERAGVSVRTIKGMEQGAARLPRADTLTRVITALRLPPQEEAALRETACKRDPARLANEGSSREVRSEQLGAEPLTPLIGREDLIQDALALLGDDATRLLTLVGPPGVGKTRVGVEVARRAVGASSRIAERVLCVALAPLPHPSLLLPAIAHEMGLHEAPGVAPLEAISTALQGKPTVLFLDNFEHLLAGTPDLLTLLIHCPEVKALVTSRAALRIRAERELPIPPLAISPLTVPAASYGSRHDHDGASDANVSILNTVRSDPAPAVALFIQRAQATLPSFALDQHNAPVIEAICREVDGLPLAIELAAARCRLFSPSALLARLAKRLPLLADHARDVPPRQQTMRGAIAWSYQLLSTREQRVFRRLAVFANGCSLAAAEAVCAQEGDASILDDLTTLVSHSLLCRAEGMDGAPRVMMLETIREFAQEQLECEGEHHTTAHSHCAYFCSYSAARRAYEPGRDQSFDPRSLEHEYANLRVALAWAIEQGEIGPARQLVAGLWRYWYTQGMLTEGRRWTEATLALTEDTDHHWLAEGQGAEDGAAQSAAAPDLVGQHPANDLAEALNGAGMLAFRQGDVALARAWLERSLALRRWLGDQRLVAAALNNLGLVAADQGFYTEAQRLHEESLALKRALGLPQDIAVSLNNLGSVLRTLGRYAQAMLCFEENLAIQRDHGDAYRLAHALGNLGSLAYAQGEYSRAQDNYRETLALQRLLGDTQGIAISQLNLAEVAAAQGDVRLAVARGQESLDMFRAFGEPARMVSALTLLSSLYAEQGDETRAVASLRTALDLYRHMREHRTAHRWLAALAQLAQRHALYACAVQLLAASESRRIAKGVALAPTESRQYDVVRGQLRKSVEPEAFLAAWEEATCWSWDATLKCAGDVLAMCDQRLYAKTPAYMRSYSEQ